VLAFYVDEQHLDMYTYKVETQQILSLSNWDYKSVSTNKKLILITWWICFSLKM